MPREARILAVPEVSVAFRGVQGGRRKEAQSSTAAGKRVAMIIRYTNTIEDLVAFSWYTAARSAPVRRSMRITTWVFPTLFLVVGASVAVQEDNLLWLALAAVAALFYAFGVPRLYARAIRRNIRGIYGEGDFKRVTGPVELELTATRLIERQPYGETSTLLEGIDKVVSTDEYTFIFLTPVSAHVIPHGVVKAGDYEAFAEEVAQRVAVAKGEVEEDKEAKAFD
jgi:hypothetical protein